MNSDDELTVIRGHAGHAEEVTQAQELARILKPLLNEGTLYLGFPVVSNAEEAVPIDALLVCEQFGVVAFLLGKSWPETDRHIAQLSDDQNTAYLALQTHLAKHKQLRAGRSLLVQVNVLTVFAEDKPRMDGNDGATFVGVTRLNEALEQFGTITNQAMVLVESALQRVPGARRMEKSPESVDGLSSMGAKLREIGRQIAFMDKWQKAAAIETPYGPQRIRGLAGSGKTVVLAHKAAYLHTRNPEWRIAITFHTRSLHQQINQLITSFVMDNWGEPLDEDKLQIVHAWGSARESGLYAQMAEAIGTVPRSFGSAAQEFGYERAFKGACAELLREVELRGEVPSIFDVVLVDEAQDLPSEFFKLLYAFTEHPKRIVWAYDEFQKLSDEGMPGTKELFGTDSTGAAVVNIDNAPDFPKRDIVLPKSYRNTPWALATAHALGLGVYSEAGLVNYPERHETWTDIGYLTVGGEFIQGTKVTIERDPQTVPSYFSNLLTPDDAISFERFATEVEQDTWIAAEVERFIANEEIRAEDCLIVLPEPRVWRSRAASIHRALERRGIRSHLVGVDTIVDEIFMRGSVAIAHIYRAKGNEAPVVFAVDSHESNGGKLRKARRNAIFTAITRSRGWVRISGVGTRMDALMEEASQVKDKGFRLAFDVPSDEEIASIRAESADGSIVTAEGNRARDNLRKALQQIRDANVDPEALDLEPELLDVLRGLQEE